LGYSIIEGIEMNYYQLLETRFVDKGYGFGGETTRDQVYSEEEIKIDYPILADKLSDVDGFVVVGLEVVIGDNTVKVERIPQKTYEWKKCQNK
jgi:hypothetical protein